MEINDRIKQVRKTLGLSQAKFAQAISISNGYIASIELGNRKVNDRIARLICSTYNVNESWLKSGVGEMFNLAPDKKTKQAIDVFKELKPDFQDYVLQQITKLLEIQNDPKK